MSTPFVSIVIPVFNQGEALLPCLRALDSQSYPADSFEVIVVDNASTVPLPPLDAFGRVRCVAQPKAGSYAARNRGVEAARGEIVGFTDADCVPAPDWIERGVQAVARLDGPGMIGGRIDITLQDPRRPTAAELYEAVLGFRQDAYIGWGFAATANVFTTRATLERVGRFSETLMSGGDVEWGQRLRSKGFAQRYDPTVRVAHPARHAMADLCRKSARVAGGLQQMAVRNGSGTSGVLERARQQLLQLRGVRANLRHEQLSTFARKVKFAGAVWLFELVRTVERYRVHLGGTAWRS